MFCTLLCFSLCTNGIEWMRSIAVVPKRIPSACALYTEPGRAECVWRFHCEMLGMSSFVGWSHKLIALFNQPPMRFSFVKCADAFSDDTSQWRMPQRSKQCSGGRTARNGRPYFTWAGTALRLASLKSDTIMRGTKNGARMESICAAHNKDIHLPVDRHRNHCGEIHFRPFFSRGFFSSIRIHTVAIEFRNRSYLRERLRIRWCLIRSIFIFFKLSRRKQWNLRCDEFWILRIDTQIRTNNKINGREVGRAPNMFCPAPQENSCFFCSSHPNKEYYSAQVRHFFHRIEKKQKF